MAVFLAVLPLLPNGPAHLGMELPLLVDLWVAALVVVWLRIRFVRPNQERSPGGAALLLAWAGLVVIATGALIVGLAGANRIGSPVFAAHVDDFVVSRILRPIGATTDPFYSIRIWVTYVEGFAVFAVIRDCYARAVSAPQFVRVASWGWLTGLGFVSLFAFVQHAARFHLQPLFSLNPFLVRVQSTLDDPNALASYLVLGVGVALGVALSEQRRRTAVVAAAIGLLAALAVPTTGSRIGLIALLSSVLLVVGYVPASHIPTRIPHWSSIRRSAQVLIALLGAVSLALLVGRSVARPQETPMPRSTVEAVVQSADPRTSVDEIFKGRLDYWQAAVRMAGKNPITGVGLGRYPGLLPEFRNSLVPLDNAHDFFLQMLAEAGVLGMLAFGTVCVLPMVALYRGAVGNDPTRAGLAFGALIGLIGFALTLLTGHPLLLPSGQALWGSVIALAFAGGAPTEAAAPSRRGLAAAAVAVLAIYVVAGVRVSSPPHEAGRWGYSWGLYAEEAGLFPPEWDLPASDMAAETGPQRARYRWSGQRILIELKPPPAAHECLLLFTAASPTYTGGAQSLAYSYGHTDQRLEMRAPDLQRIRIPLDGETIDGEGRLLVAFAVTPTFVPAEQHLSGDTRRLGMLMFEPQCR